MNIHFNEISPDEVRRESMNGKEYLVFPLKPIKPMRLHRGYVPEEHVRKSTPDWNGTPLTLNHPKNAEGQTVSANSPEVVEKNWLGYAFNFPHEPQEEPQGEGWIDIEEARSIGGEAEEIIERLDNGESVSVSSSYRGDQLPPGEYDGEHRDQVRGNIRPDHIAILPNKDGKCSIEDGCMAGQPAVNSADAELLFPVADDGSAEGHPEDTGDTGSVDEEFLSTLDGNIDDSSIDREEIEEMAANTDEGLISQFFSWLSSNDTTQDTMSDKVEFLVNERGYDEENLPPEDSQCFDQLYSNEQRLAEVEEEEQSNNSTETNDSSSQLDQLSEQISQLQENMVDEDDIVEVVDERLAANREREEKQELAETIVANSDDHEDAEELAANNDKSVLETLANTVTDDSDEPADRRGQIPASPSSNSSDNDASNWAAPTAKEREAELQESD